jgi:type I restriction enzyme S subunit
MRDGWEAVPLGHVTTQVRTRRVPQSGVMYRLLGVSAKARGAFLRETVSGAATKAASLTPVRSGQFIYNRLFAGTGSFAVVPQELDGSWVSNEFPVFEVNPVHADARYLWLVFQQPDVWATVASQCIGTTGSRMRWHESKFSRFEIPLPPPAEQRRIINLVGAVDDALTAAFALATALRQSHGAVREEWLSQAADGVRLGDVIVRIDAGRSPDAEDRQPKYGETTVLKVSAVRPGWFDRTQVKVVKDPAVFPEHALVRDGDLLMTRANGNRDLLGVVCIAEDTPERCFLSDKTLRIVPDETVVSPIFLMEALASAHSRRQIALSGTGTASMKNISQASIENLTVPLASPAQQAIFVGLTSALRIATRRAEREAVALSRLRGALVTSLLAGDQEFPDSYDRFLDGAA